MIDLTAAKMLSLKTLAFVVLLVFLLCTSNNYFGGANPGLETVQAAASCIGSDVPRTDRAQPKGKERTYLLCEGTNDRGRGSQNDRERCRGSAEPGLQPSDYSTR